MRGLANEVPALVISFALAYQPIDLLKEKAEIKFSHIGHIVVDKTQIKSYYFSMNWSIQKSKTRKETNMKKIIALGLAFSIALSLAGCASNRGSSATISTAATETTISAEVSAEGSRKGTAADTALNGDKTLTSAEANLYTTTESNGYTYVCDEYGVYANGYHLSENGDICRTNGTVMVAAGDVVSVDKIRSLDFSLNDYNVTLEAREVAVNDNQYVTEVRQYGVYPRLTLNIGPIEAKRKVVLIHTSDWASLNVAEKAKSNEGIIVTEPDFYVPKEYTAVDFGDKLTLDITFNANHPGTYKVYAETLDGTVVAEASVHIGNGSLNEYYPPDRHLNDIADGTPDFSAHTHEYVAVTIPATENSKGYTQYTCRICGESYTADYTAKIPASTNGSVAHIHSYVATVVPATSTTPGYTRHTCSCGDTYDDNYVPAGTAGGSSIIGG